MDNIYCYSGIDILKNKLDIQNNDALDLIESEQSRMEMMFLYDSKFDDFSVDGFYRIHYELFKSIYEWAGQPRIINLIKREPLLCGKSVWYSNDENVERDLAAAFDELLSVNWRELSKEDFISELVPKISAIWQVHPFREGNTRTTVVFMILFIEHYGYYVDKKLLSDSAGYVRNSFVLASFGEYSEYEHLEKILLDAVSGKRIADTENDIAETAKKYSRYQTKKYIPKKHEPMPEGYTNE